MVQQHSANGQFRTVLTADDESYIVTNYLSMVDEELSALLKVDRKTIFAYRHKNGLMRDTQEINNTFGQSDTETLQVPPTVSDTIESTTDVPLPPPPIPSVAAVKGESLPPIPNIAMPTFPTKEKTKRVWTTKSLDKHELKRRIGEDIEKLIPNRVFANNPDRQDIYLDKFLVLKRSFNDTEWEEFLQHWMRYMEEHQFDFNIAEDFDDLAGLVREIILQQNLFERNKSSRQIGGSGAMPPSFLRQLNESVQRQKKFQESLKLSRRSRKTTKDYDKNSLAELVALFDKEETRKMMADADRDDNVELLGYMDKLRKKMKEENVEEGISGQESTLLMGMDEDKVSEIVENGIEILEKEPELEEV